MNNILLKCRSHDLALLLVRVSLAAVFVVHGWQKISNIEGVLGFFGQLGVPVPLAHFVAWLEFLGGILILAGLFAEIVGLLFAANMAFAIYLVKFDKGFSGGYEFDLALLLASLAIFFAGAGRYSLGAFLKRRSRGAAPAPSRQEEPPREMPLGR